MWCWMDLNEAEAFSITNQRCFLFGWEEFSSTRERFGGVVARTSSVALASKWEVVCNSQEHSWNAIARTIAMQSFLCSWTLVNEARNSMKSILLAVDLAAQISKRFSAVGMKSRPPQWHRPSRRTTWNTRLKPCTRANSQPRVEPMFDPFFG